jgi:hypothetical protein
MAAPQVNVAGGRVNFEAWFDQYCAAVVQGRTAGASIGMPRARDIR